MTRSSRLLAVGLTVIVVGILVLLLALRGDEPVVVDGDDVAAQSTESAADVTETASATDTGTVGALAEDEPRLPVPLVIPEGHEAVAVTLGYTRGAAGLPAPGDHINVYGVFEDVPDELLTPEQASIPKEDRGAVPGVIRAVSNVEVLGLTSTPMEATGSSVTFVLALQPEDVETVIFYGAHASMWFSMVTEDAEVLDGEGVQLQNVLE